MNYADFLKQRLDDLTFSSPDGENMWTKTEVIPGIEVEGKTFLTTKKRKYILFDSVSQAESYAILNTITFQGIIKPKGYNKFGIVI